jgi:putative membrane protein
MATASRYRVPALAALLSVVSLALVFSAVLGVIPDALLPRIEVLLAVIPHLNAVVSAAAIVVIASAWRSIRAGDVARHRTRMLVGLGLFATFLVLYLYRVSVLGPTDFGGPAVVERFVYLPVLGIHILLAVVCIPLLYYVVLLGVTRPIAAIRSSPHARVGRVTAVLWLVSFTLGIVVYLMLYWLF